MSLYQHVKVNKKIKIKSSAFFEMPLNTANSSHYNVNMDSVTQIGPDGNPAVISVPVTFESLYNGYDEFTGYQILSKLVTDSILPRALRYGLLYNYFGYPVANVSPYDDNTNDYKSDQSAKYSVSDGDKTSLSQYVDQVYPQGNLAYIVPFDYSGEYEPIFYQISYLEYAIENHNEGYEADEGISSVGSYYDLAKKANKISDSYYIDHVFSYLRGNRMYGSDWFSCKVDPVSLHLCSTQLNMLNKTKFVLSTDDSDGSLDYTFLRAGTSDDGVDYGLAYQDPPDPNDPKITWNKDQLGLCHFWMINNRAHFENLQSLYSLEGGSADITNDELYVAYFPGIFGLTEYAGTANIAAISVAKQYYGISSNRLWESVTNPLHKTWAKAFLPGSITPSAGSYEGDLVYFSSVEGTLQEYYKYGSPTEPYATESGVDLWQIDGEYSFVNPGSDMRKIVGKYANTKWYWQYDLNPDEFGLINGSVKDPDLELSGIPLWQKFRYSNIASAFCLTPGPKVKNQKSYDFYLTNPNETLNAIVPQIIDYVAKVVPKSLNNSANDSIDGIKKFRISNKIKENLSPNEQKMELISNYKLGITANHENDLEMIGYEYVEQQGLVGATDFGVVGWPSYGTYSGIVPSKNKVNYALLDSPWYSYGEIQNDKPDNFMIVPADPMSLAHMVNVMPKQKNQAGGYYADAAQLYFSKKNYTDGIGESTSLPERAWKQLEISKVVSDLFAAHKFGRKPYGFYQNNFPDPNGFTGPSPNTPDAEFAYGFTTPAGGYKGEDPDSFQGVGFGSYSEITEMSNLIFPVWEYDQEAIDEINWQPLIKSFEDEEKYADQISDFPAFKNRINYGLPDWVKKISIYPSIERHVTSVGLSFYYGPLQRKSFDQGGTIEFSPPGPYYALNKMTPEAASYNIAALDQHILTYQNSDFTGFIGGGLPWVKYNYNYDPKSNTYREIITVRYVVEMEIDESQLIADLVGYGAVSLSGTPEGYLKQGFDVVDLLVKSNGNIENELLKEEYDNIINSAEALGLDPSQFPSLFPEEFVEDFNLEEKEIDLINDGLDPNAWINLPNDQSTIALKRTPGPDAENIGYVDKYTFVKVLKEWVNGKGEFHKVKITDSDSPYNGSVGFLPPEVISPSPKSVENKIFFEDKFSQEGLKLTETEVQYMSEAALALNAPKWFELDDPYYYKGDGEYWINVKLPAASFSEVGCIVDEQDLENKKQFAKDLALREILDFLNKSYTDEDVTKLLETYLVVRIDEGVDNYYLNLRPGEPVQFLVKIGAIYVKAFKSKAMVLEELKESSTYVIDLDTRFYQQHVTQALFSLNKIYLDIFTSQFSVKGFNVLKEAKRISVIPVELNRLIALNGYEIGNKNLRNRITIGFDSDFKVVFVSYKEQNADEKLLEIGLNKLINREPFVYQNTMSLFYHHRLLKNPTISWKSVVENYLINPKAQIVPKDPGDLKIPSSVCSPPSFVFPDWQDILQGIAQQLDTALDLDPRFDAGSFQFSLLQLFPPCPKPPSGKGPALFQMLLDVGNETAFVEGRGKLNFGEDGVSFDGNGEELLAQFNSMLEGSKEWATDNFFGSESLKNLRTRIFSLDDLQELVLDYVDPASLYSRICKCFLDIVGFDEIQAPNFEISAEGGSAGMRVRPGQAMVNSITDDESGPKPSAFELEAKGPKAETNFFDPNKKVSINTDDLLCSFCFNIPSVFLRLPTTNILDELIRALKALLEFALAQLLLSLIAAALDILTTCPDIQCPTGGENVRDYGRNNLNDIFDNSDVDIVDTYEACGLFVDDITIDRSMILGFMNAVSSKLSTIEILGLLDGTPDAITLNVIQGVLNTEEFSPLKPQMDTKAKIEDFFACAGQQLPPNALADLEDELVEIYQDIDFCKNLYDDASAKLADKCGDVINAQEILDKIENLDLENYKNIANIFRQTDDLSTQLPPMFSDGSGVQSIMSQLTNKSPSVNYAIDKTVETAVVSVASILTKESVEFNTVSKVGGEYRNVMLFPDDGLEDVLREPIGLMGARLLFMLGGNRENRLVRNIDIKFKDLQAYVTVDEDEQSMRITTLASNVVESPESGNELMTEEELEALKIYQEQTGASSIIGEQMGEGANNQVILTFNPPSKEDGQAIYTNNYTFGFIVSHGAMPKDKLEETIQSKNNVLLSEFNSYPERFSAVVLNGKEEEIPVNVKQLLDQYPLDGSSEVSEHSQFFGNLITGGIYSGGVPYNFVENFDPEAPAEQLTLQSLNLPEDFYSLIQKDIYWSISTFIINSLAKKVSENGLLGKYDDNPFNKIDGSVESILGLGGVLPVVLAMAIASPGFLFIAFKNLTRKLYRRELQNLDLAPAPSNQGGSTIPIGLINFAAVSDSIKMNYDMSKFNDPTSEELQPTNLAFAEGWIGALIQLHASEFFCKGIHTTSVFPIELFRDEETIIEYIFSDFEFWLNLPNNNAFTFAYYDLVNSIIRSKSEWTPDDEASDFGFEIHGEIFDLKMGKPIRVDSWQDATKMLIRRYYMDSLSFIKNRVNQLQLVGNEQPKDLNPISILTYPQVLEIADPPYGILVPNTEYAFNFDELHLDYKYDELDSFLKSGIGIYHDSPTIPIMPQSLFQPERVWQFWNGKFFFQTYFKLTELKPNGEKYKKTVNKLIEKCGFSEDGAMDVLNTFAQRSLSFKGHVSKRNLQFIVNELANGDAFMGYLKPDDKELFNDIGLIGESGFNLLEEVQEDSEYHEIIADIKFHLSVEDFFESVNMGVRMCFGFADTDDPEVSLPIQFLGIKPNYITQKMKNVINDLLNDYGDSVEDDLDGQYGSLLQQASLTKSLRVVEDVGFTNGGFQEKYSYIFPIISNERTIVGEPSPATPHYGVNSELDNYFKIQLDALSNPEHYQYYDYKIFMDNLMANPSFSSKIATMVSEIIGSTPYESLFKYSIPVSRIMSMVSIYNAQEVSLSTATNVNFIGTKAVLKDILLGIYKSRGKDSYKNESESIKKSGGSSGTAVSSYKSFKGL